DTATTLGGPVSVHVLANDSDPDGDPLTITDMSSPTDGTAVLNDNGTPDDPTDDFIVYTPGPGFPGYDSFSYTIDDGQGGTDVALVSITYTPVTIGDFVWLDLNNNGLQDTGEQGVAGVSVSLCDAAGSPVASMQTDAFGHY